MFNSPMKCMDNYIKTRDFIEKIFTLLKAVAIFGGTLIPLQIQNYTHKFIPWVTKYLL